MVLVHILLGVISAVLRSVTSAFLLLVSMGFTAAAVVILVGLLAFGLTGLISLRLSRRRGSRAGGTGAR